MDKIKAAQKLMQEREKEHFLLLSLSNSFARCLDYDEFLNVINQELKDHLLFDFLAIGTTDQHEKQYRLFFHSDHKIAKSSEGLCYDVNDCFFYEALHSADPVRIELGLPNPKKSILPPFITNTAVLGMRELVILPLEYHKHNPSVLFLFFKKPQTLDRNAMRLLKGLTLPLALAVSNILVMRKLESNHENGSLLDLLKFNPAESQNGENTTKIIGNSAAIKKVKTLIHQVASSDSGVLILGESGTGKEVVASEIHNNSTRSEKPMIKVNCAAIPVHLIESELFGHEKGSFTGAVEKRIGKFELANNGTLFLDEIGDLPLEMQTKLLRVLQEREFDRIGSKRAKKVNVRIIAATNKDLQLEMQEGRFRKDLFYRLNIFPVTIPPLRDRKDDIPDLCLHFLNKYSNNTKNKNKTLSASALKEIIHHSWPGNIRELEHCIERSMLLAEGPVINDVSFLSDNEKILASNTYSGFQIKSLKEMEKEYILKIIKLCNGRISGPNGAAVKLEIPSTTLISKMQKLGIKKQHFL